MDTWYMDEGKENTLREMMSWYSSQPKDEIVNIHYGGGMETASTNEKWVDYMVIQLERGWYRLVAREILNGLRKRWILYGLNLSAKGSNL